MVLYQAVKGQTLTPVFLTNMKKVKAMKSRLCKIVSSLMAIILIITAYPLTVSASPSFNQMVNAATEIIMSNEGNYTTVVKNDMGALSIGKICWHATNALNLLKDIVTMNPSQAVNILGASLYNEIVTSTYWESRIATQEEANAISVLLSTSESRYIQDKTAWKYVSDYINHGISLGITEPEALVFFADYENQNGMTGAKNFYNQTLSTYGKVNLATLYECSSKNWRRTKTYNYCVMLNWNSFEDTPSYETDKTAPEITDVSISDITSNGYTVTCSASDNEKVSVIYFVVYRKEDGISSAKWYSREGVENASCIVNIKDFGSKTGEYCTFIYVFDQAGNYISAELNTITVPEAEPDTPPLTITVTAKAGDKVGSEIKWRAAAANGSGNYQYEFILFRDDIIIDKRKFNDFSDFSYTVTKTGSYHVIVNVKDIINDTTATVTSSNIDIFTPITAQSVTSDTVSAMLGDTCTWSVIASGGEGKLSYSYTVYKDDTSIYSTDFSERNTFSYIFKDDGIFNVIVTVMDSRSQVVTAKSSDVKVMRELFADNITFSKAFAVAGQSVTCSGDVIGGSGSYFCIFSIYCDGELILTSPELTKPEFTFTVSGAGEYTAEITVTDIDGTVVKADGGSLKTQEYASKGDANCDGKVNASDARFTLRCSAKLDTYDESNLYAIDVTADGKITAADARLILRASARLETL